jgi:hypothetical protein
MGCFGFSFGKERNTQDSTHAGDIIIEMYLINNRQQLDNDY